MGTGQRIVSYQALAACGAQEFHPVPIRQICWHLFVLRFVAWKLKSQAGRIALAVSCDRRKFYDLHMLIGEDAASVVTELRALLLQ
jgi:hypothetical protein